MNGILIAFEGGDGSGKKTQARLLVKALEELAFPDQKIIKKKEIKRRHRVAYFDFPQYGKTVYGALLKTLLHGERINAGETFDFLSLDPYVASCPYALDRVIAKSKLLKALAEGIVVCNRYTPSNIAHQCAKLPEDQWEDFTAFVENAEYGELKLPRPNLTIYLSVPASISSALFKRKKDQHEANMLHQERARAVYEKLSAEREDWTLVSCAENENNALLPPEAIHKKIMDAVRPLLRPNA